MNELPYLRTAWIAYVDVMIQDDTDDAVEQKKKHLRTLQWSRDMLLSLQFIQF